MKNVFLSDTILQKLVSFAWFGAVGCRALQQLCGNAAEAGATRRFFVSKNPCLSSTSSKNVGNSAENIRNLNSSLSGYDGISERSLSHTHTPARTHAHKAKNTHTHTHTHTHIYIYVYIYIYVWLCIYI